MAGGNSLHNRRARHTNKCVLQNVCAPLSASENKHHTHTYTSTCTHAHSLHYSAVFTNITSHKDYSENTVWNPKIRYHDDVIKWNHFPRYWPFVRGIHRSPVNSHHKGQWLGALMFSLICTWINGWAKNREAGDLRRHRAHYVVIGMWRNISHVIPLNQTPVSLYPVDKRPNCKEPGFDTNRIIFHLTVMYLKFTTSNRWMLISKYSVHLRHNKRDGVSNHRRLVSLLNRLFRRRSKEASKLRVIGLWGEFTCDRWIPRTMGLLRWKCFHLMPSSCVGANHEIQHFVL